MLMLISILIVLAYSRGSLSNAAICPSVCLSHAHNSTTVVHLFLGLWLLQDTNR